MNKYEITLTPVDKFFFGGDMTFKIGNQDDGFNEKYSSYIIQSHRFPQQTSLLGMLRFLILRNAGEDVFKDGEIVNKSKARCLIGGQSFSVNSNHESNQYGKIISITGVKVRRIANGIFSDLFFAPLLTDVSFVNDKYSIGSYNLQDFCIPDISKDIYNAKDGLKEYLTDGSCKYGLEEIFKEDRRIGIGRDIKTGKTDTDDDEGTLFKQISYRFNNIEAQHCFVFNAVVDDEVKLENYSGQLVSVGGDNSHFIVGISKEVKDAKVITPVINAIQILSPTFLTREEAVKSIYAVTKLQSFRFLESKMENTKSYHILSGNLKRSMKYQLYSPGSIFFFVSEEKRKEFAGMIEAKNDFRQIGYNEYI